MMNRDRVFVFLAGSLAGLVVGTVLTTIIGVEGRSVICEPPSKPECVCKAETCPREECPPPVECPPQPTLEIHKPLSEELDAVVTRCKPAVDHALAALEDATVYGYEAMDAARQLGVSALKFEWLENEEARKAATALFYAYEAVNDGLDAAYEAVMACRRPMEDAFHGTDAWLWIDDEETEEPMTGARGFATAMYEFFNQQFQYGAECNAVARRLECPLPKPVEEVLP